MTLGGNAQQQLRSIIERVERLEVEKKAISDDINEVYAEAKSNGYDVKVLREVIRVRKQDADERATRQALLDTYMHALGMLADLPLGQAAIARDVMPDIPAALDRRKGAA